MNLARISRMDSRGMGWVGGDFSMDAKNQGQELVRVGLVVLNFNGGNKTVDCLKSIENLVLEGILLEVLVVDNASTDDSLETIQALFPEISVLRNPGNLGYASGNNRGVERLLLNGAEFIWILNNDALVEPLTLVEMLEAFKQDDRMGVVGSVADTKGPKTPGVGIVGGTISWGLGLSRHLLENDPPRKLAYLSGASVLVRKDAWLGVGGLCEEYFLYWEDADFCLRLNACGWSFAVARGSRVVHDESSTLGAMSLKKLYYMNREFVKFVVMHSPFPLWTLLAGYSLRIAKSILRWRWVRVCVILRAAKDGWRHRKGKYFEMSHAEGARGCQGVSH